MDDIVLYLPDSKQYLWIYEGTGDNLLNEDRANGFVDYLNYEFHESLDFDEDSLDGGMQLLDKFADDYTKEEIIEMAKEYWNIEKAEILKCEDCKHFYECDNMGHFESCYPEMRAFERKEATT